MSFLDVFRGKKVENYVDSPTKQAFSVSLSPKTPQIDHEVKSLREVTVMQLPDGFTPMQQFDEFAINPLARAMNYSAFAFACMVSNAAAQGSLPPMIQRRGRTAREGKWVEDRDHDLNRVLEEPLGVGTPSNPRPRWAWDRLISMCAMQTDLVGNTYMRPIVRGKDLRGFIPLLPNRVRQERSLQGYVRRYQYNDGLEIHDYAPDEVIHLTALNPGSLATGSAPFEAAMHAVIADRTIIERIRYNLENKIAPGLIVTVGNGLTEPQRDTFYDALVKDFGTSSRDGFPLLIGGMTDVQVVQSQISQTLYAEQEAAAKSRILAVFRTPPPMIGDFAAATLQNFDRATAAWWIHTLLPNLKAMLNGINQQVVRRLYGPDVRIWYDIADTEIGLILLDEKIKAAQGLVNLGYPPNWASRHVGLDMPFHPDLEIAMAQMQLAGRAGSDTANLDGATDPNDQNHTPGRDPQPDEVTESGQRPG